MRGVLSLQSEMKEHKGESTWYLEMVIAGDVGMVKGVQYLPSEKEWKEIGTFNPDREIHREFGVSVIKSTQKGRTRG